jgi:peptidoglycan/LPS O-acetylase OafA/YrhL
MIQRVQSLFFFFASIFLITIVFYFPVLQNQNTYFFLTEHFTIVRFLLFFSAGLSIFAVFQFKDRKRQIFISTVARFVITIAFFLLFFLFREDNQFGLGTILLIVPFISLIAANFFIKKDEKLVKSADRIR